MVACCRVGGTECSTTCAGSFEEGHHYLNGLVVLPTFFNLSLNLAIYLGPNSGGGNEDDGDLLQEIPCMYFYTQCPNPQQATTDPCLLWRLLDSRNITLPTKFHLVKAMVFQ